MLDAMYEVAAAEAGDTDKSVGDDNDGSAARPVLC
jgi:hypothetical protein